MNNCDIDRFLTECRKQISSGFTPDCLDRLLPEMHQLLKKDHHFIKPEYLYENPDNYSRNVVYIDENNQLGLYVLVWLPGQWTPVHDHGTWGMVGIMQGVLYEYNYTRIDRQPQDADNGIQLMRGGSMALAQGSLTSFVADPDHIHLTGNPGPAKVVSLHLYGNSMAGFNAYDPEKGTRKWIEAGTG